MSQPADNPNESFLLRMVRCTRQQITAVVEDSKQNAGLLKRSFEQTVYEPIYEAALETRDLWRRSRREKPEAIVATATAIAMMASIPFGRWAFVRNSILTAGLTFSITSPETLVDILKDTRPRRVKADQASSSSSKQ